MPIFITYASYSQTAIKGMVSQPEDRTAAIQGLLDKAGAKLIAAYMTTGTNDIVLISEAADESHAVAAGMAASAGGGLSKVETVRAWTLAEFKSVQEKAARAGSGFKPPGT